MEQDHTLNHLVITIQRTPTNFRTSIYGKPIFTDTIIPYTSNHPTHHKYEAVRFLFNRLHSYNLQHDEYQHELNIIHNILQNNVFPIKPYKPRPPNPNQPRDKDTPKKWTKFTYIGKETSYITIIIRRTDLRIAFNTKNTTENLLTHKIPNPDIYTQSGAYTLTCPDCNEAYVGHTGRQFAARYG
jgi:hypothetical protein